MSVNNMKYLLITAISGTESDISVSVLKTDMR